MIGNSKEKEKINKLEEIYIPPEKRQKIIDDLNNNHNNYNGYNNYNNHELKYFLFFIGIVIVTVIVHFYSLFLRQLYLNHNYLIIIIIKNNSII